MESFIVSARKYRPRTFEEVVGQEHVTKTLRNEIRNQKLAQAFLFCGPRGVGKTTCARILAREINKDHIEDPDYDQSFSIFELDAASNNSVEDIRELTAQVRIPPQVGKYKVYIIDEVHMLSVQAFNAFLKTLEEPPAYAIFILATTEKHKILPTVLSRCQVFNFNRIAVEDMVVHLKGIAEKENKKVEEKALHIIAQKSDGALRDALSMFDQLVSYSQDGELTYEMTIDQLHVLDYQYFFRLTDAFINVNVSEALLIYDEILAAGFDGQIFLNGLAAHFRDLMVAGDQASVSLLEVPEDVKRTYLDKAAELSDSWLINAINIANKFDFTFKSSSNTRLHVELSLIKMCHIRSLLDLTEKKKRSRLTSVFDPKPDKAGEPEEKPAEKEQPPEPDAPSVRSGSQEPKPEKKEEKKDDKKAGKKPDSRLKTRSKRKGLPSANIDEIIKAPETEKVEDQPEHVPESDLSDRNEEFTFDDVLEAYRLFGEELQAQKRKSLNAVFKLITPVLEGRALVLHATSTQIIQINAVKAELQRFMRDQLKNDAFSVELVEIQEKQGERKPYTDREKLDDMISDNPSIDELQKKFGLDLE